MQEELEYWKSRAARLSLLVDQVSSDPCRITIATLKTGNSKLVKVRQTETSFCIGMDHRFIALK